MSSLYLREDLDAASVRIGAELVITGAEARHAITVSRTRLGERLIVGNGSGLIASGPVIRLSPSSLAVAVEDHTLTPAPSPRLVLVQALAKGDRDELAIQAATELGVDAVVPWSAARSVSRWTGPKAAKGVERWQTIVREATKQSIRPWIPEVFPLATTADLIATFGGHDLLVLVPGAVDALAAIRVDATATRDLVIVVGPEGGIDDAELQSFEAAGGRRVRLGASVLRTSSAGPAALAVLNGPLGRW